MATDLTELIRQRAYLQAGGGQKDTVDKIGGLFDTILGATGRYQGILKERLAAKKAELEVAEAEREQTPARFILGQSPKGTKAQAESALREPIPAEDLASGRLDTVQKRLQDIRNKVLEEQGKYGEATFGEMKKMAEAKESLAKAEYYTNPALRKTPLSTQGAIASGYASREFVQSIFPNLGPDSDISIGELQQRVGLKKGELGAERKEEGEKRGETRKAAQEAVKLTADQEKTVKNLSSLKSLVDEYFTKLDELIPTSDTLADVAKTAGRVIASKVPVAGSVAEPDIKAFETFRDAIRPKIARALGDVGNLSEPEQKTAIKLLTGGISSNQERIQAKQLIEDILFKSEERAMGEVQKERSERARGALSREGLVKPQNIGQPTRGLDSYMNDPLISQTDKRKAQLAIKAGRDEADILRAFEEKYGR